MERMQRDRPQMAYVRIDRMTYKWDQYRWTFLKTDNQLCAMMYPAVAKSNEIVMSRTVIDGRVVLTRSSPECSLA